MDDSIYFDGVEYDLLGLTQRHPGNAARVTTELAFYLEYLGANPGPVLELACGTGRLSIPFADAGFDVVGIDIADPMLRAAAAKARGHARAPEFKLADVRNFKLGRRFSTLVYPDSAMCHLHSTEDIEACLACVRGHLALDGQFIVAVFNPWLSLLTRDPTQRYPTAEYVDANGRHVTVTENNVYEAATQVNHVCWYYQCEGEPEVVRHLDLRMFFPQELRALLNRHGFTVEAAYGDFDRTPIANTSPRQILVCKLATT